MFGTSRARVTVNFKRTRSLVDLERVMLNARDGNALQSVNIYKLIFFKYTLIFFKLN